MPETYLNSPKTTPAIPPAKPLHWTPIIIAAIAAGTIIQVVEIAQKPVSRPAAVVIDPAPSRPITPAVQVLPEPLAMPTPAPLVMPTPEPLVMRALPVEPIVRRGLPVEGNLYAVTMPDGTHPLIRFMGLVESFDQLPKNPNLYDLYTVASSGHQWVFMQPAGFAHASWVDP